MNLANLKICGITSAATARFCAAQGVGALGAVFHDKSPRCVTPSQARDLFRGLPSRVARVGVCVDLPVETMLDLAATAALDTLQLHGHESRAVQEAVLRAGYRVVKVLKTTGDTLLAEAEKIPAEIGILIECGQGALPGGNGAAWAWEAAAPLAAVRPVALAGGLTPGNIADALRRSGAAACDVSSGVERAPGIKDHAAIQRLVHAVRVPPDAPATPFWGHAKAHVDHNEQREPIQTHEPS